MAFWNRWRNQKQLDSGVRTDEMVGRIPDQRLAGQARADEWLNIISGHGTDRDKRTSGAFSCDAVPDSEARELWRGDDIARKIIELLPKEMVRQGYVVKAGKKDKSENISDAIDTLGINRHFSRAKMYERAYGGSAIWPVLNDGAANLAQQLNENSIQKIRHYQLFEPRELQPQTWYMDASDEKFGQPKTYRIIAINGGGGGMAMQTEIHESRMIIFPGIRVSREAPSGVVWGWGDNVLTRVRAVLRDFHLSWASVASLLADIAQGVFKMDGLAEMLENQKDDVVRSRLAIMDYARSVMRSIAIDSKDDFQRQSTPMGGVPEILVQFATRLAAAAEMPVTMLMGMSPAGMNATGDSDTRGWYGTVGMEQEQDRPLLERLIRFSMLSIDGPTKGKEPPVWGVEFNPLWAPTEKERADTRYTVAQTDKIYIDAEVVSREEVAASRWKGDTYSPEMTIDWKAREAQEMAAPSAVNELTADPELDQLVNPADPAGTSTDVTPQETAPGDKAAPPPEKKNGARLVTPPGKNGKLPAAHAFDERDDGPA